MRQSSIAVRMRNMVPIALLAIGPSSAVLAQTQTTGEPNTEGRKDVVVIHDRPGVIERTHGINAASEAANRALVLAKESLRNGNLVTAEQQAYRSIAVSPTVQVAGAARARPLIVEGYEILGRIRLLQGRPAEARNLLLATGPSYSSESRDLNLIISYSRLGDYRNALRIWADTYELRRRDLFLRGPEVDRPIGRTVKELQALALFVSAVMSYGTGGDRGQADLLAAEKLLPRNPMIAFELGKVLADNGHLSEALTRFNRAASLGHGDTIKAAKPRIDTIAAQLRMPRTAKTEQNRP